MCGHKRIRCTNCEYFCLDCGAKLEAPPAQTKPQAENPKRGKKTKAD